MSCEMLEQTSKGDCDTISSTGDLLGEKVRDEVRRSPGQSCLVILNVLDGVLRSLTAKGE